MSEFKKVQDERKTTKQETGGKCNLCTHVLTQPKKRIVDFYEAMIDRTIENQTIKSVLTSWGISSSETVITNHRNGRNGYAMHMANLRKAAGHDK